MQKFDLNEALENLPSEAKAKLESLTQVDGNGWDIDSLAKDLEIIPPDIDRAKLAQILDPFLLRLVDALDLNPASAFLRQQLKSRFGLSAKEVEGYISALKRKQAELVKVKKNQGQLTIKPSASDTTRWGNILEGEDCYLRVNINRDGTQTTTPISSFIIKPHMRITLDGYEAVKVDFVTNKGIFRDIIIERHQWHSRSLFMKTFPSLDLLWIGGDNEVQAVQGITSQKDIPRRIGTRALGYKNRLWILPEGAISKDGWVENSEILYVPRGGKSELEGRLNYRRLDEDGYRAHIREVYAKILTLNAIDVMFFLIGWFFATPFKQKIRENLGHFPILNVWGTKGGGQIIIVKVVLGTLWGCVRGCF